MSTVIEHIDKSFEDDPYRLSVPDADFALKGIDITVSFRKYAQPSTTLKEALLRRLKGQAQHYDLFNALDGISFRIPKGLVYGYIGSNGAGKSTLLRVLAGILPPTGGELQINGTVDSLIQLGAGFDNELNAIENIYLNGALHRQTKREISMRVDKILDFAELRDFAETPIKYYSSGMFARLGFSVAIDRDPDILIVDEVLAVGDQRFQEKSLKVFEDYVARGKTIIIVSHDLDMVRKVCHRVGLLSRGKLVYVGSPEEALRRYNAEDYKTALHG